METLCDMFSDRWILLSCEQDLIPFYERFGFVRNPNPVNRFEAALGIVEMDRAPTLEDAP